MRRLGLLLPQLAFVAAVLFGAAMTAVVWHAERGRDLADFERVADLAIDRVVRRLEQHVVILQSTRGLFAAAEGAVSRDAFRSFIDTLDIERELPGIQGIGFARMIARDATEAARQEIAHYHSRAVEIRPETRQDWRALIVLLEPEDARNQGAIGFDMYADDVRRVAMDRAIVSGQPRLSGPVELVQEITQDRQTGFLIYLAYGAPAGAPVAGFVFAPFRGGDFVRAALSAGPPLPVALSVRDAHAPERALHEDPPAAQDGFVQTRTVDVLGRQWSFTVTETQPPPLLRRHLGALLVTVISLLFAAAMALAIRARQQEAAGARAVAAAAAREADYRGLLLQEMKHRINNHIARIQSIARQSARGATDVQAFTETFGARLQAMAAVQDILAGAATPQAEVRAILRSELRQCLDTDAVEHLMDGPPVRLNERQAHAFALVAHELVTNAMKYGGLSAEGGALRIRWTTPPGGGAAPRHLALDWRETFPDPRPDAPAASGTGFGSRLVEASVKGELSGTLTRAFAPDGLRIALHFPLDPALAP